MKIRLALCLALASSLTLAQASGKPAREKQVERAAMLDTLQRGKTIVVNQERYVHLPEVIAVERRSRSETPQQAIARSGAGGAQIVETRGAMVLYRSARAKQPYTERFGESVVYATVLNTRTGAIGVLPGTLVVKLKSMADAAAIASRHGLEIVREFPQLQTMIVRAGPNVDIVDAVAALRQDPGVGSAYPEVVERLKSPR
jgi:hypothetical protein